MGYARLRKTTFSMLTFLIGIYLLICAFLWFNQRNMLYYPTRDIAAPEAYGLSGVQEQFIKTPDGTRLQLWVKPAQDGLPTLIYFHGNGGHLGYRQEIYRAMTNAGLGLIALSYRGYGKSQGKPDEAGMAMDTEAALNFALTELQIPPERIILYGESLGTHFALRNGANRNLGAIVLMAPFSSIRQRASEMYWWLPVPLLLKDSFDSYAYALQQRSPVLIMHGEADRLIPIAHARKLMGAIPSTKELVPLKNVDHYQIADPNIVMPLLHRFATRHELLQPLDQERQ